MAKGDGQEVSIHLTLGDNDFAQEFNKILGGLTDQLNQAGKQFAQHMENAEKSIRQSSEALEQSLANEPRREPTSSGAGGMGGGGGASGPKSRKEALARANRLMDQMEKESLDAAQGASRLGTEYEDVLQVVNKLNSATENLNEASGHGALTGELQTQNKLRKQAEKTVRQLIGKIKKLANTQQITREEASEMLQELQQGAARYSDAFIKAEKAIQSVQSKSLTAFRKDLRRRVTLVQELPKEHDRIKQQLEEERQALRQQVEANKDNAEALDRLKAIKKTLSRLDKQKEQSQEQQKKSLTDLRKELRAQITLVDSMPERHDRIREELQKQKQELVQKAAANEDNVETLERLKAVKKTISKLDKKQKKRREAETRRQQRREKQEIAGDEMAFAKNVAKERERVEDELDKLEKMVQEKDPFERLIDTLTFAETFEQEAEQVRQELEKLKGSGLERAEALKDKQQGRLQGMDEEIDRLTEIQKTKGLTADQEQLLDNLQEDRAQVLKDIESTERQIQRIKEEQTAEQSKQNRGGPAGRKQRRRQMRADGTFKSYNAAMQVSRLAQDAPYGMIGMVNNLDMAFESMQRLTKQADTLRGALKSLFFGAGAASGMLWLNMLSSAVIMLNDTLDLSKSVKQTWSSIKTEIMGAESAIDSISDKIDEVSDKKLKIAENTDPEEVMNLQEVLNKEIQRLEKKQLKEKFRNAVPLYEILKGEYDDWTAYVAGGPLGFLFGDTSVDEEISKLRKVKKKLDEEVADGMGMKKALKKAKEYAPLIVEEHKKVAKKVREFQAKMAEVQLSGRSGEEALPFKKDKIKAEYKKKIRSAQKELDQQLFNLQMAQAAGNDEAALKMDNRIAQLQRLIEAYKNARDRELQNVGGEDVDREAAAAELMEIQQKTARKEISLQEDSLEKKKAIINQELKAKKQNLDQRLKEFEGTAEQEAAFREEIEERKTQAERQAQQDRIEAERQAAREKRKIQKKNAEIALKIQKRQTELNQPEGRDSAEIERSRIKMEQKRLDLKEKIAQAEANGYEQRAQNLRTLRDMEERFHEQRVSEIRKETQEMQRQTNRRIQQLTKESELYKRRTETFGEDSLDAQLQRIQIRREEAMNRLESQFQNQMSRINEADQQSDTLANNMRAFQQRLDLFRWFMQQKENIRADYQDREAEAIRSHNQRIAQTVGQQLSSRLGEISSAMDSLQQAFVKKRKKQLIEQGMAEEKAADKAEKEGERRFAIKKKIAIAEALVNTYNTAMQVFNNTPGELTAKLAAAGAAITFGLAQVAKIRAQSIGGGDSSSGGGVDVSGLGSTTDAAGSQVTDSSSAFASDSAGASTSDMRKPKGENIKSEVKGLRGDMQEYTQAVIEMNPEATLPDDTAIEVGEKYEDHKSEDKY